MATVTSADFGRTMLIDLRGQDPGAWGGILLPTLRELESSPGVCAAVVAISAAPPKPGQDAAGNDSSLRELCLAVANCPKVIILAAEGHQDARGLGLSAAADLVVAGRGTTFRSSARGEILEDLWLAYLPLRTAKWLALGAGEVTAAEGARLGFINALAEDSRATDDALALARSIGRVPADVLRMKKAANDFRLALPRT
jgi:enoyl-CoA hydratase/carnithine racemase